jgi:hypothetical protein
MHADEKDYLRKSDGGVDRLKTGALIKGWALRSCTSAVPPYPGSLSTASRSTVNGWSRLLGQCWPQAQLTAFRF